MFGGNWNLTEIIGLNHFNTEGVANMNDLFRDCYSLKILDLSSFSTKNVKYINNLFTNSSQLQTIYISDKFDVTSINSTSIFDNCTSLVGGAGTKYDPTFIDSTAARIDGGINSPGYFTSISDKPLETTQTNESDMSDTTGNEVRNVETPAKEPDELETDSKQNELESQQ